MWILWLIPIVLSAIGLLQAIVLMDGMFLVFVGLLVFLGYASKGKDKE